MTASPTRAKGKLRPSWDAAKASTPWKRCTWDDLDSIPLLEGMELELRHNARHVFRRTVGPADSLSEQLRDLAQVAKRTEGANPKITGFIKVVEHTKLDNVYIATMLAPSISAGSASGAGASAGATLTPTKRQSNRTNAATSLNKTRGKRKRATRTMPMSKRARGAREEPTGCNPIVAAGSTRAGAIVAAGGAKSSATSVDYTGAIFRKHFPGHGVFVGRVLGRGGCAGQWHVHYAADDDSETLDEEELVPLLAGGEPLTAGAADGTDANASVVARHDASDTAAASAAAGAVQLGALSRSPASRSGELAPGGDETETYDDENDSEDEGSSGSVRTIVPLSPVETNATLGGGGAACVAEHVAEASLGTFLDGVGLRHLEPALLAQDVTNLRMLRLLASTPMDDPVLKNIGIKPLPLTLLFRAIQQHFAQCDT